MQAAISVALLVLIAIYSLRLMIRWGWLALDGVMTKLTSHLPERPASDAYDDDTMSSQEIHDDMPVSSRAPNQTPEPVLPSEPQTTGHKISPTQMDALWVCFQKGLTSVEIVRCIDHDVEGIRTALATVKTRGTLARAMGGAYAEQLRFIGSVAPLTSDVQPMVKIELAEER